MSYTNGTWEQSASIIHCENGVICQLSEPRKTQYVEHYPVAISSPDWQEAMDNGKLIKAAPALLAALTEGIGIPVNDSFAADLESVAWIVEDKYPDLRDKLRAKAQAIRAAVAQVKE